MTEQKLSENNLVEQLRITFPELEDDYQEQVRQYPPTNYMVVGFAFKPRFRDELAKGEITEFLRRSALFIERVCSSGDHGAINVIWIELFEWLIYQPNELKLLWPVLGPATKAAIRDAARRWSDAGARFGHTQGLPTSNLPED